MDNNQQRLCSSSNQQQQRNSKGQTNQNQSPNCDYNKRPVSRPSQQSFEQDPYNRCVHFAEKSCASQGYYTEPQSGSVNRTSINSTNDQDSCDCQQCRAPGHPCDCAKCRTKKATENQALDNRPSQPYCRPSEASVNRTSTSSAISPTVCKCPMKREGCSQSSGANRSGQSPRNSTSCDNSTDDFVPLLSSTQKYNQSYNTQAVQTSRPSNSTPRPSGTSQNAYLNNKTSIGTSRTLDACRQSPEMSANRTSTSLANDPTACNCQKCRSPGHPCDCPKCEAKKEAHRQSLGSNRSSPRQSISYSNNTNNCAPTSSRGTESYRPLSSTQRTSDQCDSTNMARPRVSCQCKLDERPTTSTRTSCNNTSLSNETRRSLLSSELNKTLFHPNSHDKLNRNNFGSIDQLYSPKDNESLLVEDTYNPGLIEDCVAGRKDFNAVSFGMFFENTQQIPKNMPEKTPMTLLEAIYKRIDVEREHMADALNCKPNSDGLDIDSIELYFSCKPQTELNIALSSLFKAEALYNESAKPGTKLGQQANDEASYEIEVQQTELPLVGGCPITVECYTGTTTLKQASSKQNNTSKKQDIIKNEGLARRKR